MRGCILCLTAIGCEPVTPAPDEKLDPPYEMCVDPSAAPVLVGNAVASAAVRVSWGWSFQMLSYGGSDHTLINTDEHGEVLGSEAVTGASWLTSSGDTWWTAGVVEMEDQAAIVGYARNSDTLIFARFAADATIEPVFEMPVTQSHEYGWQLPFLQRMADDSVRLLLATEESFLRGPLWAFPFDVDSFRPGSPPEQLMEETWTAVFQRAEGTGGVAWFGYGVIVFMPEDGSRAVEIARAGVGTPAPLASGSWLIVGSDDDGDSLWTTVATEHFDEFSEDRRIGGSLDWDTFEAGSDGDEVVVIGADEGDGEIWALGLSGSGELNRCAKRLPPARQPQVMGVAALGDGEFSMVYLTMDGVFLWADRLEPLL